jgi:tetratricopeptide (TPR) repeat protein
MEECGNVENVGGNYFFISGRKGDRSKDPNKYLKDALILEKASEKALLEKDPLYNRYIFYCAQSYNSCNNHLKAIEFYKKALTLDLWIQEKYMSCIEIFDQYGQMNMQFEGLSYLVESVKYDRTRVEGIYRLVKYYCVNAGPDIAYMYYTLIKDFYENHYNPATLGEKLFAKKGEHDFYLPYYMIIVGERTKHYDTCVRMYEMIFKHGYIAEEWWMNNLFYNLQFIVPYLPKEPKFVQSLLEYVDRMDDRGIKLKSEYN